MIWLHYLQFICKATNEHGIHSPFVFDLATHCFYNKKWKKIRFLPVTDRQFVRLDQYFIQQLKTYFQRKSQETQTSFDVVFMEPLPKDSLPQPKNNSIWVFSGLHRNRKCWQSVSLQAPISIDFFFWGMVCFKKDQAPEAFFLRIL